MLDKPNGIEIRRLASGTEVEVVDWQMPFIKLAGGGVISDPSFDGDQDGGDGWERLDGGIVVSINILI